MLSFRSLLTGFLVLLPFVALLIAISGRHPLPSTGTVSTNGLAVISVSGTQLSEADVESSTKGTTAPVRQIR